MTKKIRLLIFFGCLVCFVIIAPYLVLYSMGYRIDFKTLRITATGGIYVRTFPAAEQITIDSKFSQKPRLFANSIFVQNLLPDQHTVLVQKTGYFDYFKTIPVEKNQVTKLENITLFKEEMGFQELVDTIDYFSISPNNQMVITVSIGTKGTSFDYFPLSLASEPQTFSVVQMGTTTIVWSDDSALALIKIQNSLGIFYYLFDSSVPAQASPSPKSIPTVAQKTAVTPLSFLDKNAQQASFSPLNSNEIFYIKNKNLYAQTNGNAILIIEDIISYKINGDIIVWLSTDGMLYRSDVSGKSIDQLSEKSISTKTEPFNIITASNEIFLQTSNSLFRLDKDKKILENLPLPAGVYKISSSPDQENLIYWNGNEIYFYSFADKKYEKLFSGENLTACQWVNNYYIVFVAGDNIIISEIDYRGEINTITLPQTVQFPQDKMIDMIKPQIFFERNSGKLYFLTDNTFLSSEKILP